MVAVASTSSSTGPQSHIVSVQLRKTIQSIKEVVGNFSDSDILMALEESHMDPDETTQKLLNQVPFCEVKRKREKKKESMGYRAPMDSSKHSENSDERMKLNTFSDHNPRQGGFTHVSLPRNAGINRQFRVVKDNRVNHNTTRELNPASQISTLSNEQGMEIATGKSSGDSSNAKPTGVRNSSQIKNRPYDSQLKHTRDTSAGAASRSLASDEKRSMVPNGASRVQAVKPNNSQHKSAMLPPSNSAVGVYLSSTDPIHVPSPDSRTSAVVGAIKRDVGVVGGRRLSSENPVKDSSGNSFSNSVLAREPSLTESFQPFLATSRSDHVRQTSATEPLIPSIPVNRPSYTNHYNSRPHQQATGNKKASLYYKEWKPKTNQKSSTGTLKESSMPAVDTSNGLDLNAADLQDKFSQVNVHENQNVIIAQHIRVSETDRCRLTFGSIGVEFDCSGNIASGFQSVEVTEDSNGDSAASFSVSAPESTSDNAASEEKQVELLDDQVRNSGSDSSISGAASEQQLPDKSSSPPNLDNYADIGLVQDGTLSFAPTESQQQQDPPELPNFSAYDSQAGYDVSYFRPPIDDVVRGQGLPVPQEVLTSHTANSLPTSAIPLVQQQQHLPSAQMYPQVHVSHFANFMPYRQIISPVYVPQMAMPGYSSNPAYPHPSNGNNYLLMPGANSHLGANGIKYGIQQLKPIPGNSPTGFGSFSSPIGYAINAPGVVGSATGLDDSSRMKYKDVNLYASNPQADSSEIWIPNPREIPSLQSAPFYNMPGQTPHAAYMPSHAGHASFNAATAQSSHMQFPGLYAPPPPQLPAMTAPHHLAPVMGGNVGVGVAPSVPGTQVGAYQQPQLGHLNWTTNFLK